MTSKGSRWHRYPYLLPVSHGYHMPDTAGNLDPRKHDDALVMHKCTFTHRRRSGTARQIHAIAPSRQHMSWGKGFLFPPGLERTQRGWHLQPGEVTHLYPHESVLAEWVRRRDICSKRAGEPLGKKRLCRVYGVKERPAERKIGGEKAAHYLYEESGEEQLVCRMIPISSPGCLRRYYCSVVYSTLAR